MADVIEEKNGPTLEQVRTVIKLLDDADQGCPWRSGVFRLPFLSRVKHLLLRGRWLPEFVHFDFSPED